MEKWCPDCGTETLQTLEETEQDSAGEYKEILTCTICFIIIYIIRMPK